MSESEIYFLALHETVKYLSFQLCRVGLGGLYNFFFCDYIKNQTLKIKVQKFASQQHL